MRFFVLFFVLLSFAYSNAWAQRLGNEEETSSANAWIKTEDAKNISISEKKNETENEQEADVVAKENFVPKDNSEEELKPTLDGSVRGRTSVRALIPDKQKKDNDQYILMYMENFTMEQIYEGTPSCSMRFIVLTNLDRKVSQFAVKLVWPQIATTLSFVDIRPNTRTYYDYTLLGEGCYTMDVEPNIIVNRCRIKGSSSKDCASKIRWLRDAK